MSEVIDRFLTGTKSHAFLDLSPAERIAHVEREAARAYGPLVRVGPARGMTAKAAEGVVFLTAEDGEKMGHYVVTNLAAVLGEQPDYDPANADLTVRLWDVLEQHARLSNDVYA